MIAEVGLSSNACISIEVSHREKAWTVYFTNRKNRYQGKHYQLESALISFSWLNLTTDTVMIYVTSCGADSGAAVELEYDGAEGGCP